MATQDAQGFLWLFFVFPLWMAMVTVPISIGCFVAYFVERKKPTFKKQLKWAYIIVGIIGLLPLIIAAGAVLYMLVAYR